MNQPKRQQIKYVGQGRSPKQNKKHNKIKQIKSKIFRNLNQIPILLTQDQFKENRNYNAPNRVHSALQREEGPFVGHRAVRVQSALSHYHQPQMRVNKKRLSLDSTGKRYERESLASRNSLNKKMSKNTKLIDQTMKIKLAQQRKRSNLSCISAHEESYHKISKKHSVKQKRPSVGNLHVQTKAKGKQNKSPDNKQGDKSRSRSKRAKRKSTVNLDRSKVSTALINTHQKGFAKKKHPTSSTACFGPIIKKKKKQPKKKSPRRQNADQFSLEQYPINKYEATYSTQKMRPRAPKSRSKSRKGSHSKQPKRLSSGLSIDYASCINIPSNSSGLINSRNSQQSKPSNSNIKIVDNWEYRYFGQQSGASSVNLEEIRYYESFHYSRRKQQRDFMDKNFKNENRYNRRRSIQGQISEEYPQFGQLELKFLSSVIFIQRRWREHQLYRQIFKNLANSGHKISQNDLLEQSNSKQLSISKITKSPQKMEKKQEEEKGKQERVRKVLFVDDKKQSQVNVQRGLRNEAYLDYREISDEQEIQLFNPHPLMQQKQPQFEHQHQQASISSVRSHKYPLLELQLFPSLNYLQLKQQQLKHQLQIQLSRINQLQLNNTINTQQYLKLRSQFQQQYRKELKDFQKTKKDIKKGFLKFVETLRDVRHEGGLRRVSSESGPMASLYLKVFNLEKTQKNSSSSSDSLRMMSKKVLIRREFYHTQPLQPQQLATIHHQTHSARDSEPIKQIESRSARLGRQLHLQIAKEAEHTIYQIPLESDNLGLNRIREGFNVSPQIYQSSPLRSTQITSLQQQKILEGMINTLTHQLFCQLIKIDEKRENTIDIILQPSPRPISRIKTDQILDFQFVDESESVEIDNRDRQDDFQIVEEFKFREIFKIEGLIDKPEPPLNRKHRNSPHTHHISPQVHQPSPFDSQPILLYTQQLLDFIKQPHLITDIIKKLNKNQGFTPKQYLRFLRDFQIPEEQYDPLITNQIFIEWEEQFYCQKELPQDQGPYSQRQAITIFHRCIFEAVIILLQEQRPSGDKGEPFPWQKTLYFPRPLTIQSSSLFSRAQVNLSQLLQFNCGLIEQHQLILSEQDMQRLHEQNQDRIISMLQGQLHISPHNWYEVQQHSLQIRLQVQTQIYEYIMLQALDELLQIL